MGQRKLGAGHMTVTSEHHIHAEKHMFRSHMEVLSQLLNSEWNYLPSYKKGALYLTEGLVNIEDTIHRPYSSAISIPQATSQRRQHGQPGVTPRLDTSPIRATRRHSAPPSRTNTHKPRPPSHNNRVNSPTQQRINVSTQRLISPSHRYNTKRHQYNSSTLQYNHSKSTQPSLYPHEQHDTSSQELRLVSARKMISPRPNSSSRRMSPTPSATPSRPKTPVLYYIDGSPSTVHSTPRGHGTPSAYGNTTPRSYSSIIISKPSSANSERLLQSRCHRQSLHCEVLGPTSCRDCTRTLALLTPAMDSTPPSCPFCTADRQTPRNPKTSPAPSVTSPSHMTSPATSPRFSGDFTSPRRSLDTGNLHQSHKRLPLNGSQEKNGEATNKERHTDTHIDTQTVTQTRENKDVRETSNLSNEQEEEYPMQISVTFTS